MATETELAAEIKSLQAQLAAAQALAVLDTLTRRNRLPGQRFFVVAQGANRPLASNATQAGQTSNRRIELVVYPETVDTP